MIRIAGVDINFHPSWLIILLLIAYTLGDYFHTFNHGWSPAAVWGAAAVTTIMFFVSVILHELAHSLLARSRGLPVHTITLFVFGGASELAREPDNARDEFQIAIVGPATSFVLGAIFWALAQLGAPHQPAIAVLEWLSWINLALAVFNLIPGFPLDGGRVLRAIFWSANHDFVRSTRWATRGGQACALGLILYGVFEFFAQRPLEGLWIAFIGWFLMSAAEQSWRQTQIEAELRQYTVGDLETPFYSRVAPDVNLEAWVTDLAGSAHTRASLVMDSDDHLLGIISAADVGRVPRERWGLTLVHDAMVPRAAMATVQPGEGLASALRKMVLNNVGQLPIISNDGVHGVIRRDRILQLLHTHLDPHGV